MADGANEKMHVVVFPWLGFSHIINFFTLSKFIALKGHRVSFVTTPKNIDRLSNIILPPSLSSLITFVKVTLPKVEGLREDAEATMDVGRGEIPFLIEANDGLEPELTRFLEAEKPDWIIYDFNAYWVPPLAAKFGISRVFFWSGNAWFFAYAGPTDALVNDTDVRKTMEDMLVPPPWIPFPTKLAYRTYEVKTMFRTTTLKNSSGISIKRRFGLVIAGAEAIFVRHCLEFEPQWIGLLEMLHNKPVIPVGLMPPSVQDGRDDNNKSWLPIKDWLDTQTEKSVVYVALGTEVPLTQDQLTELALGLELSGLPFFWTLKIIHLSSFESDDLVELPEGFLERTKDRGMVWTSWAPQLKILGHESVGGFLTHCGNGSIVEGMMFGQPLIMLPFYTDQGPNARLLVDNKFGVEVPRDEEDGSFTREGIAESIRKVMVEDEGKTYKARAKEISAINGDRELQNKYIENAVNFLETHRQHTVSESD